MILNAMQFQINAVNKFSRTALRLVSSTALFPKKTSDEKTLKVKLFSFYYSGAAIKWNEFFDAHFQYTKSYANIKAECESLAALHMYMRGWY